MKVRHVAINPMFGSLRYILDSASEDGFALSHVVTISEYQAVLVFMKPEPEERERERVVDSAGRVREIDENGSYL